MLIVCGIVLMTAVFSGCTDADADAPAPHTQLSDAPTGNDDSAIRTLGGESLDDLFDMAKNNPDGFLEKEIEKYKLIGLGEANGGSGVIENSEYNLKWDNPIPGIERYTEFYGLDGKLTNLKIIQNEENWLTLNDIRDNDDMPDEKINRILFKINGGEKTKIVTQ